MVALHARAKMARGPARAAQSQIKMWTAYGGRVILWAFLNCNFELFFHFLTFKNNFLKKL